MIEMRERMPDSQQTLEEILKLAAAQFKVPRERLTPDDDFFKTADKNIRVRVEEILK